MSLRKNHHQNRSSILCQKVTLIEAIPERHASTNTPSYTLQMEFIPGYTQIEIIKKALVALDKTNTVSFKIATNEKLWLTANNKNLLLEIIQLLENESYLSKQQTHSIKEQVNPRQGVADEEEKPDSSPVANKHADSSHSSGSAFKALPLTPEAAPTGQILSNNSNKRFTFSAFKAPPRIPEAAPTGQILSGSNKGFTF